jgi:succinate-semialdehyde dehydrogenase/glutarate-semialdehyde dehydrogenase
MQTIKTINPYTQEPLKTYDILSDNELIKKIANADVGFQNWRQTSLESRSEHLRKLAELLLNRKKDYAKLMAEEMGKPIAQGIAEIEKCAWVCDFYAKNASNFLADQLIETDANESFISYDPLGVILAIMPWNYPFSQVLRFAAPTLMAGNTVLLKHAANTTQCGLEIEKLLNDAGFPEDCFQTLVVSHEQIEQVVANDAIKAVSLTGSEKAGKTIAQLAGKYLKKSVLELGGNNACVILKDANLERFIETMAWARMQNAGQSCIAAKRFIVEESIHDEFIKRFITILKDYPSGNPLNESTKIGPMARIDLADEVEKQVESSLEGGAEILFGNKRDKAYYEPTLVGGVAPGMSLFDQEVFGPVAAVIKAKNKQEAYSLAQMSKFGLGCMVFTEDIEDARHRIGSVPDGAFFVNEMVKSDPRLPFGGTKSSGYGRELSKEGIMEFVNKKTVFIRI